jgi:autoinducer 2-degrading protein
MISLVIVVEVNPEKIELFREYLFEEAADAVSDEPGCRDFFVSQSKTEPHVFTLVEFYDDEEALEEHRLTPHFLLFQKRAKEHDLIRNKREVVTGDVIFPIDD